MARIGKAEHPRILHMVDGEHRKVADVAAEYGCTPANIYALLGKLRRQPPAAVSAATEADAPGSPPAEALPVPPASEAAAAPAVADLFARDPGADVAAARSSDAGRRRKQQAAASVADTVVKPSAVAVPIPEPDVAVAPPPRSVVTQLPGPVKKGGGVGAGLAKPGMALVMRTAEGEENLTPFRSLDDLLSAVKPILRAAARSPDAVWFSIQPVDLAALDSDAA